MIVNRREHFCVSRVRSCLLHTVTINLILESSSNNETGDGNLIRARLEGYESINVWDFILMCIATTQIFIFKLTHSTHTFFHIIALSSICST